MSPPTVVARLTPSGPAGLGTIALVGPAALSISRSLFSQGRAGDLKPGQPYYGWFGDDARDDVVLGVDEQSAEPTVEISCHGGPALIERLIADIAKYGAYQVDWRTAERLRGRSEFQSDALAFLARAVTARTAAILLDQVNGALDRAFAAARAEATKALAVLKWSDVGRWLERPARVVLFGLPNAGKSTLFNALVGYSRLVTSPAAGTTRDVVSELISMDGWPVELSDGAGLGDQASLLEAEAMRRIGLALEDADLRVLVEDASSPNPEAERLVSAFEPGIIVANKMDLPGTSASWPQAIRCSAATGQGVQQVREAILNSLVPEIPPPGTAVPFLERHRQIFRDLASSTAS